MYVYIYNLNDVILNFQNISRGLPLRYCHLSLWLSHMSVLTLHTLLQRIFINRDHTQNVQNASVSLFHAISYPVRRASLRVWLTQQTHTSREK